MFESLNPTGTLKIDGEGKLLELAPWSDQDASAVARDEGIELTPEHLTLLKTLRAYYLRNGPLTAREILQHMENLVADQGGRRYLYQLFPNGPVRQACHIIGLPIPGGSSDPSFGNVM
jgi:tRNA 2-thiouridine synthesizing protein E